MVVNNPNSLGPGTLTLTAGTLVNTAALTFTNLVNIGGSFTLTTTSLLQPPTPASTR